MAKYQFNMKNKSVLDETRSALVYQFNLAQNMALLSNDPVIIRNFYRQGVEQLLKDQWLTANVKDKFMAQDIDGQAFVYFGLCPMVVQGVVNLVASNGFKCESKNKEIDAKLNEFIEEACMPAKFAEGVYLESGLGDFLYRLSYDPQISDKPLIDVIEPQFFEVNYLKGHIRSFVIKCPSTDNVNYQLREIYYKNKEGDVCITYRFYYNNEYVDPSNRSLVDECKLHFNSDLDLSDKVLPFKDFPLVFKKNANSNQLYKGERGVPDIQGLDTIEDALTETISDLTDAIRKGGIKEYIDEQLIPTDADGRQLKFNPFNKTIFTTKGSSSPANPKALWQVTQAQINWEAYTRTIQNLMSIGINKAGLAPTTLGLTGLESINSSAESQEAREKTSLRKRELSLKTWEKTLKDLLNMYLQMLDYIEGKEILDYSSLIKIHFDDYISPSVENVTEVLANQVMAGLKSQKHAIKDLNDEYTDQDADNELLDIMAERGQPVLPSGGAESETSMENSTPKNANLENSNS